MLTRNMRIAKLPNCQERMIRMLSNAKGKTYEEKVKDVGLTSLTERQGKRLRHRGIRGMQNIKWL